MRAHPKNHARTTRRLRSLLLCCLLGPACAFEFHVDSAMPPGTSMNASRDAGGSSGDADLRDGDGEATSKDAGLKEDEAGTEDASASRGVKHSSCSSSLYYRPEEPRVATDATGRPKFDLYRDLACDEVPFEPCVPQNGSTCPDPSTCPEGTVATSDSDGRCRSCVPIEDKARFCCQTVKSRPAILPESVLDCRAWPYPGNGNIGMLCARHADCNAGLVCVQERDYGVCTCPGESPSPVNACDV